MRILTWNLQALMGISDERIERYVRLLESADADVLLLQEAGLKGSGWYRFAARLETMGYASHNPAERVDNPGNTNYGSAIAVRGDLKPSPRDWVAAEWPELIARATVSVQGHTFDVISAHMPNGSGCGWKKIDHFEALAARLAEPRTRPLALGGDFNEPRIERPDGRMATWGQDDDGEGGFKLCEPWTFEGRTDTGERWDSAVRSVLDENNVGGLVDVFRHHHGPSATEATHVTRGNPRQFDHVLTSPEFRTSAITFGHYWRGDGLSDHSAVWVDFELG